MNVKLDKLIAGGLLLTIVLTVLAHGTVESWSMALYELAIIGLLAGWAIHCAMVGRVTISIPAAAWPIAAWLLFGVVQACGLSLDPEATRLTLLLLFCQLAALLLCANFLARAERIESVAHFLVVFGFLLAVFGLIQHFTWNGKFYWVRESIVPATAPFGPFVNHNHFAGYVEMILPLPVAMILLRTIRSELSWLYGFAAMMMGVATVLSLSRGGMLGMSAGLIFTFAGGFWQMRRAGLFSAAAGARGRVLLPRLAAAALVVTTIIGGIFWVGADPVIERVARTQITGEAVAGVKKETLFQSRGFIWHDSLKLFREHALFGVGLGAYPTVYPQYSGHDTASFPVGNVHNDYLQILTDTGLVGGALALWFLVVLGWTTGRAVRRRNPRLAALGLGGGGGLAALAVHSCFDFNLQLPANALLFLLLVTIVSFVGEAGNERIGGSARLPQAAGRNGLMQGGTL